MKIVWCHVRAKCRQCGEIFELKTSNGDKVLANEKDIRARLERTSVEYHYDCWNGKFPNTVGIADMISYDIVKEK